MPLPGQPQAPSGIRTVQYVHLQPFLEEIPLGDPLDLPQCSRALPQCPLLPPQYPVALPQCRRLLPQCEVALLQCMHALSRCNGAPRQCGPPLFLCRPAPRQCTDALAPCIRAPSPCSHATGECRRALPSGARPAPDHFPAACDKSAPSIFTSGRSFLNAASPVLVTSGDGTSRITVLSVVTLVRPSSAASSKALETPW